MRNDILVDGYTSTEREEIHCENPFDWTDDPFAGEVGSMVTEVEKVLGTTSVKILFTKGGILAGEDLLLEIQRRITP